MTTVKKKMASAATIAVFLLCCFITASTGSQDDCVYAATGSSLTVPLRYELKESDNLKWFKDTRIIFYRRRKQVIMGKNDAVDSTGSLKLTQLTKDKSGRYIPEVHSTEGINVGDLQSVRLCVLDRVQKPSVTMTCIDSDSVSFTCNAGQKDNTVRFEWTSAETQLEETGEILIKRAVDVVNTPVVCRVSNPISFAISDPVIQNCFTPSSQDDCVYAATGSSFTVPLKYELKESDQLKWFKDTIAIFYRRQKQVILGKNDDVDSTGSLKLTQLTKDKSGRYKPEVYTEGINAGDLPSVHLCVLDPVQKPTVTRTCTPDKTKVTFTCNVGKSEKNFQIKWFMVDKKTAEKEIVKDLTRPVKDVLNARFFCNVSNRVSSETSQPVQQDCKFSFPDTLFGISIWVFVGGGAGIVLVLILIVIICSIRTKRKRRLRLKDERELRLQWGNQEQQHHHHQHHHQHHQHPNQNNSDQHHHPHHHQQQPAGNTGPRQHRSKQPRTQQRPRAPEPANGQPQPSPRRATQVSAPGGNGGEEQPPPLPQPRKKTPKAPKE
uniref:CD2 molecule n=1 Tax=Maylandia zebra TaxID=106582 RepID=A0A3P9BNM7_9CICH|nr:T-cell surface antigen CD2 isoform X2 [Maylandia zebra]